MTSATVSGTTTTFAYRGDGLRNSRTTGGVTTTFTWDIAGGLPVVLDDGNQYVYGGGLVSQTSGANTYYYLADGLGSTMAMVDTSGTVQKSYTYDVYGKPTATGTLANEFDFAGQQTDPTGLQYLRARYMDPATGGFISRDPLASIPGWLGQPFGYVSARPTIATDPTGLCGYYGDPGDPWCKEQKNPKENVHPEYKPESKPNHPWINVPLLGEYVVHAVVAGLERYGSNELAKVEFFETMGPKIQACAADAICATEVAASLHLIGVALQANPWWPMKAAAVAVQALALAWDTYSAYAQFTEPPSYQAVPTCGYYGEAC